MKQRNCVLEVCECSAAREVGWLVLAVIFLILLSGSIYGHAQSTTSSQVNGTVTDSTGALVIGASVTVTNSATGVAYHAVTDNLGAYHVTDLLPGTYTMVVTKNGFETQHIKGITLIVGQLFQQNIALAVGQTEQTVSVSAAALLLNTESSHDQQLIESQQIDDMPLNGRDYLQLAQLDAGVVPVSGISGISSPASSWASDSGVVAVDVSGLREDDNSYLFDGIETRNAWYGAAGLQPDPDMVQEFVMVNSAAPAQYGVGGAFFNTVTRSGTNHFHGTAYEYLRNNDFDARNYFDVTPGAPAFHQNQFGASVGGPIKRDRMFFFGNYEGFRQLVPNDEYNLVPNSDQESGNFSADTQQLYNPYILDSSSPTGYAPLKGNQVPPGYFSAIGQKILALYPSPKGSYLNGTANYFNVATTTNNWNQFSGRVDYTVSAKDTVFGRYTGNYQTVTAPGMTTYNEQIFPSAPKNLAIGWTHIFSPRLVNNVRYGWSHTAVGVERADGFDTTAANPLGLFDEEDQPGSDGPPSIGVNGYGNPGNVSGTDLVREGLNMWTESLMWVKGNHQLTAGVDIRYEPMYLYEDWSATSIGFSGVYSGDPVADLLMGVPNSTRTSFGGPTMNLTGWYQSYYVEDTYKANRKLILNYGVRWEHRSPPIEANNRVGSFDIATGQDLTYPDTKVLGLGRNMVKPVWTNWAPRFGFNYLPSQRINTDIKGGFGMYYMQPNINQYEVEVDTTQLYEVDQFNNPAVGDPLAFNLDGTHGVPGMYSAAMTSGNFSAGGPTVSFIQPNAPTPYAYEWNLTVDHTVKNWLFEVAYVGTSERHYEERNEIDPLNTSGVASLYATCGTPQNPVGCYSGVQENQETGTSNYEALIARTEKRFSSGFSAAVNYTLSKCLGTPYQDEFAWHVDMHLDYSHCTEDINDIFTANGIYELPFGHGKMFLNRGAMADAFAGGWKIAGIATLRTGPWTTLGSQQNIGFFDGALPDLSGPINNHSLHGGLGRHGRLGPYINTQNVINLTAVGVQGNSGTHTLENPGYQDYDVSAYKTWKFGEQPSLSFRADFFNVFNRVNFQSISTYDLANNFGDVSAAYPAREIQLSLRFSF
ncbi:MAG: carboxypeptidase regulatory-like domain-containing protein [Terracidiphilus sp.]